MKLTKILQILFKPLNLTQPLKTYNTMLHNYPKLKICLLLLWCCWLAALPLYLLLVPINYNIITLHFYLCVLYFYKMTYWFKKLYNQAYNTTFFVKLPKFDNKYETLWLWRLYFLGLCHEELYARIIETFARRTLIAPALFVLDKFISSFMNNLIIINTLHVMHNFLLKNHLSAITIIKIFLISTSSLLIFLNILFYV